MFPLYVLGAFLENYSSFVPQAAFLASAFEIFFFLIIYISLDEGLLAAAFLCLLPSPAVF